MLVGFVMVAQYPFLFGPTPVVIAIAARTIEITAIVFAALVVWQNIDAERLYRSLSAISPQQM